MRKWQLIPKTKERKYPIKRDEYGQSARSRAFAAFDAGKRPAEIYEQIGISKRTRPMEFFPHEESARRIFYGVTNGIHQNGHHPLASISAEMLT